MQGRSSSLFSLRTRTVTNLDACIPIPYPLLLHPQPLHHYGWILPLDVSFLDFLFSLPLFANNPQDAFTVHHGLFRQKINPVLLPVPHNARQPRDPLHHHGQQYTSPSVARVPPDALMQRQQ